MSILLLTLLSCSSDKGVAVYNAPPEAAFAHLRSDFNLEHAGPNFLNPSPLLTMRVITSTRSSNDSRTNS